MKNLPSQKALCSLLALLAGLCLFNQTQAATAETSASADKIARQRIFGQPVVWVGDQPPNEGETAALADVLEPGTTHRPGTRIEQLEEFIISNPSSPWTPSIQANLAVYYRASGRYTKALAAWESAWNVAKLSQSSNGRSVADYTLANWSALLSSLGRVDKLQELEKANGGRILSDLQWERRFRTSLRNLRTMETQPGISYKCGTFSLLNVGRALNAGFRSDALKDLPSPATGFALATLVGLAEQNNLDLVPAHRLSGNEIVVPSVVHFRQNHYAAIVETREGLYRVSVLLSRLGDKERGR